MEETASGDWQAVLDWHRRKTRQRGTGMARMAGVVAVMLAIGAAGAAQACDKPAKVAAIEAGIAKWVNAERGRKGLGRLGDSNALDRAAQAHACDMASRGYFGHKGPGGPSFQKRLRTVGYGFSAAVENIAQSGTPTADSAASIWRNSKAHWANVLNPSIREMGVGVATDGSAIYFVFVGGSQ